jgi:hypothetical protein
MAIARAPLRYRVDSQFSCLDARRSGAFGLSFNVRHWVAPGPDRVAWVRLVWALFGAFAGVGTFLSHWSLTSGGTTALEVGFCGLFGVGVVRRAFRRSFLAPLLPPTRFSAEESANGKEHLRAFAAEQNQRKVRKV